MALPHHVPHLCDLRVMELADHRAWGLDFSPQRRGTGLGLQFQVPWLCA